MEAKSSYEMATNYQHCYVAFTDGSLTEGRAGASIVFPKDGVIYQLTFPGLQHPGLGELHAIKRVLELHPDKHLLIYTDYLFAANIKSLPVYVLAKTRYSVVALAIKELLDTRTKECYIFWIKGHQGIPGNELADANAKASTRLPPAPPMVPKEPGDLIWKGAPVGTSLLSVLIYEIVQPYYHTWVDIDIAASFGDMVWRKLSTHRLVWICGVANVYGFAYHLQYKVAAWCPYCTTDSHPLDFLSSLAFCCTFAQERQWLFDLWPIELIPLIKSWFASASPLNQRYFVRTLVPTSLVYWLKERGFSRAFIKKAAHNRFKRFYTVIEKIKASMRSCPVSSSPLGEISGDPQAQPNGEKSLAFLPPHIGKRKTLKGKLQAGFLPMSSRPH
jgi:hypothetical protein